MTSIRTVLVDDVPHYACSILTQSVRGRRITTIEGLAGADGRLHVIARAIAVDWQCAS